MATSKDQTTTTTPKGQTAAKKTEAKTEAPYADQAAALADDTRELAESIRDDLGELADRINHLGTDVVPGDNDGPTADGVRRLPAAVAEVQRTVQALVLAAADLSRQATL